MVVSRLMSSVGLPRVLELAFRMRPHSEFIIPRDQRLTRGQVLARCQALASGLKELGV